LNASNDPSQPAGYDYVDLLDRRKALTRLLITSLRMRSVSSIAGSANLSDAKANVRRASPD